MSHAELKSLETRRNKVKEVLKVRKGEQVNLSREINQLIKNVKDIESSINALKVDNISNKSITVTEHAILRYLERVEGIDMEAVKKSIVSEKTLQMISKLGPGYYPCDASPVWKNSYRPRTTFRIRVKDNAVVTVLLPKE